MLTIFQKEIESYKLCSDPIFIERELEPLGRQILGDDKDCSCVQELISTYDAFKDFCECNSCNDCKCDPWALKKGVNDTWYMPEKYDYLKCHIHKQIDHDDESHTHQVDKWIQLIDLLQTSSL